MSEANASGNPNVSGLPPYSEQTTKKLVTKSIATGSNIKKIDKEKELRKIKGIVKDIKNK
jgi:hypothetical protein